MNKYLEYTIEELEAILEHPYELELGCEPFQYDACLPDELKEIRDALNKLTNPKRKSLKLTAWETRLRPINIKGHEDIPETKFIPGTPMITKNMNKLKRKKELQSFRVGELDNYYTMLSIAQTLMNIDKEYKERLKKIIKVKLV